MNEKLDHIMLIRGFRRLVELTPESPRLGLWSMMGAALERRATSAAGTRRSRCEQG